MASRAFDDVGMFSEERLCERIDIGAIVRAQTGCDRGKIIDPLCGSRRVGSRRVFWLRGGIVACGHEMAPT